MIDRGALVRALTKRNPADWVVIERDQQLAVADNDTGLRRAQLRTRWQLTVHADTPTGRGTAHVEIDAVDGDPDQLVNDAIDFAEASVGPAWATIPSAAPARVDLADAVIANADPMQVAEDVLRTTKVSRASVMREHVQVAARAGFHTEWLATFVEVDALVAAGARSIAIHREARRIDGLDLDAAIADAHADLVALDGAGKPIAGPCTLVLAADAMLHGGLGVWQAFVSQADATVARQNLTRYHEHEPIAPGADQLPDPLSITSNGALPYGVLSAPLGDDGAPVRRFTLVDRGIAAGLGMSPREAALRKREPNGGVRNLVVAPGEWTEKLGGEKLRVIEVRRLRELAIDPYTGDASLEIGLAIDRGPSSPFAGGTLRLDLIAMLARARRAARRIRRGPYDGPAAVMIERAELIA